MPMPVSTWVEVDLDRFASNLRAVRELLARERAKSAPDAGGPAHEPEILLVLKADAYGHGAVEMAQAAEREGVAHFGVATLHEGIQLRQAGSRLPIVVLSPLLSRERSWERLTTSSLLVARAAAAKTAVASTSPGCTG